MAVKKRGLGRGLEFVGEALQRNRFFHGVEVFTLDVFDQRHGDRGLVLDFADDGGNRVDAGELRRTPAAFTGDDFVFVVADGANDDGLHHALGLDGVGQFLQRGGVHVATRLVTAALQEFHRQVFQLAINGNFSFFNGGNGFLHLLHAGKESVQTSPATQSAFFRCRRHDACLALQSSVKSSQKKDFFKMKKKPIKEDGAKPQ
jgi:hypothetical protein